MELRHLEAFVAVAEELHFGRAATRLHMAQPPLSRRIQALEAELGVALFNRSSRKVELTEAGLAFLDEARAVLERIGSATALVRRVGRGEAGVLRAGYVGAAMEGPLSGLIRRFVRENQGIELQLKNAGSAELMREIHDQGLHCGFLSPLSRELAGLEALPLVREPHVLALPEDHALAREHSIPLERLRHEPLILFPRQAQYELFDAFVTAFQAKGFSPRIVQEAAGSRARMTLAAAGLGLALIPASAGTGALPGVVIRPVQGELPVMEICLVHRPDPPPHLARLIQAAREHVGLK